MTELLSKAFKKASELSEDTQDIIATRLLEEIDDEVKWDNSFNNSKEFLNVLSENAINESNSGKTHKKGFDEI